MYNIFQKRNVTVFSFEVFDLTIFNLLLASVSYFYVYLLLLFNLLKNNLTNSMLNAKKYRKL